MTKLSLRLKAIADLIDDNTKVIDVGCDHAFLDIYLVQKKNCKCLATDVSKTCILKALENIKKAQLEDKIETAVTDGLQNVDYKKYDYVVISGMGFQTIQKILMDNYPNKLIIQSNNNIEELKMFLFQKYKLVNEQVVFENGIYYVVLYLELGEKKYKKEDYILVKGNINYINYLLDKYNHIYYKLPKKHIVKKLKLKYKIKILMKYKKTLI
ncbi:MAG: SAM-dependent methyltransferase [Firmicutes bacterium]|nr:SAM-dependent methyltransferase [Bacillota bacterium]